MHDIIKQIKMENEELKKKSENKYFENKIIDTELKFYNRLNELKKNNCITTIIGSLIVSLSLFLGIHQSFDFKNIVDVSLLIGSSLASIGVGYGIANIINNKFLSYLDLDSNSIDEKETELLIRRHNNIKQIDCVNRKLMINNDEIERIFNNVNNDYNISNNKIEKKDRKLVLKKLV